MGLSHLEVADSNCGKTLQPFSLDYHEVRHHPKPFLLGEHEKVCAFCSRFVVLLRRREAVAKCHGGLDPQFPEFHFVWIPAGVSQL